jgi:hypothetical protein
MLKALKPAGYDIKDVDIVFGRRKTWWRQGRDAMDEHRINPKWISCRFCG